MSARVFQKRVTVRTRGREFINITHVLADAVRESRVTNGLCSAFLLHTSASLVIQENADPSVLSDLARWFEKIAPEDPTAYEHDAEGPDDMPSHMRSAITKTSETLPIQSGELVLGTWQAVYVWEHRRSAHHRSLALTIFGT